MNYVIFDIDGTLNQTSLYAIKAYKNALKKWQIEVTDEEIIACFGLTPEDIVKKFFGTLSDSELEEWRHDIVSSEFELMDQCARCFEGTKEMLKGLKEKGYQLAICSNAYPEHIKKVLESIGLTDFFHEIAYLKKGDSKKDVLAHILKNINYEKACMVGDRIFDLEAARVNNIPFIGCLYGYAPNEIKNAEYTVCKPIDILNIIDEIFENNE
ncbi:HAD family hydrolase [Longibaculum muris]|uniref:HAD family hydrolase n=1 Tax=Longibaculum muris TaxID=1796628 RepID=UPI0012B6C608|nr:HAD family hydrolase [Longibaculum muris]